MASSGGVVFQWLDRIGLGYAIPNFSALGIVAPQDLMAIDVKTYNALGILKQDDRKRLFELVQRVRDVSAAHSPTSSAAAEMQGASYYPHQRFFCAARGQLTHFPFPRPQHAHAGLAQDRAPPRARGRGAVHARRRWRGRGGRRQRRRL
jgi:hypothetical protein